MKETGERQWRLGDIPLILKNAVVAIVKGRLLMSLKIDKYFLQIVYTFILCALFILFGLKMDVTLSQVENNKKELQELEILRSQRQYELIKLNRRSTVSDLLEAQGSKVSEPEKPASILEIK